MTSQYHYGITHRTALQSATSYIVFPPHPCLTPPSGYQRNLYTTENWATIPPLTTDTYSFSRCWPQSCKIPRYSVRIRSYCRSRSSILVSIESAYAKFRDLRFPNRIVEV